MVSQQQGPPTAANESNCRDTARQHDGNRRKTVVAFPTASNYGVVGLRLRVFSREQADGNSTRGILRRHS